MIFESLAVGQPIKLIMLELGDNKMFVIAADSPNFL